MNGIFAHEGRPCSCAKDGTCNCGKDEICVGGRCVKKDSDEGREAIRNQQEQEQQ
ncbi:hypothetical protein BDAP_002039 [Binucleata daphniae]